MEYHPDEYPSRFCPDHEQSKGPSVLMLAVILIGWFVALALVGFITGDSHAFTAQAQQEALEKKQALMGMPCTWVAVCIHEPCSVLHRRCAPADLTERK